MLNVKGVFERMQLSASPIVCVRELSQKFEEEGVDVVGVAKKLIKDMVDVDRSFDNATIARLTTLAVGEAATKANLEIGDIDEFMLQVDHRVQTHMTNPKNLWMYVEKVNTVPVVMEQVVEGIDVQVAVKADGSIKKGGKQVLAAELYKRNVLEATVPMTTQQFVACLIKELDMTKPGATTYTYNCKKQLGEPVGGIVKSKKGRK